MFFEDRQRSERSPCDRTLLRPMVAIRDEQARPLRMVVSPLFTDPQLFIATYGRQTFGRLVADPTYNDCET